MSLSRGFA